MRGIVFVVRSNSNGLHKIGVTKDWLRSSKQLQVGQHIHQEIKRFLLMLVRRS